MHHLGRTGETRKGPTMIDFSKTPSPEEVLAVARLFGLEGHEADETLDVGFYNELFDEEGCRTREAQSLFDDDSLSGLLAWTWEEEEGSEPNYDWYCKRVDEIWFELKIEEVVLKLPLQLYIGSSNREWLIEHLNERFGEYKEANHNNSIHEPY